MNLIQKKIFPILIIHRLLFWSLVDAFPIRDDREDFHEYMRVRNANKTLTTIPSVETTTNPTSTTTTIPPETTTTTTQLVTYATTSEAPMTHSPYSHFPYNVQLCKEPPSIEGDGLYVSVYCTALLALWLMIILSLVLYQFRAILGIKRALQISPCLENQLQSGEQQQNRQQQQTGINREQFELRPFNQEFPPPPPYGQFAN